ncbi:MAG TPA: hypothetical protein PLE74_01205 [Candidatus Cloacimonadota bacterium]|nr:hypothetical protein [Candidatus Cloacimonadota bacterium]
MKVDIKKSTIAFKDGTTPTPNVLLVKIGDGNITFKESKPRTYELDKGLLDTVRDGDQVPVDVTLDFLWEWLKADTGLPPTPVDVLKKRGNASAWVTASSDPCEPYSLDLEIVIDPDCADGSKKEVILLSDFRYEELNYDLKAGQISVTGKCNITEATITRVTSTT